MFKKALIIEDDFRIAESYAILFWSKGIDAVIETSRDEAFLRLTQENFDVCILDYQMAGMTAEEFIPKVRLLRSKIHFILISGNPDIFEISSKLGVSYALAKPFSPERLYAYIQRLFEANSSNQPNIQFRGD